MNVYWHGCWTIVAMSNNFKMIIVLITTAFTLNLIIKISSFYGAFLTANFTFTPLHHVTHNYNLSIIPVPFYHAPLLPAGQLVEVHLRYLI